MEYFLFATIAIYLLYSIYLIAKSDILSEKLLPREVKYRYKFPLRLKAMFLKSSSWENEIHCDDKTYFINFNENYRNYLRSLSKVTIIFIIVMFLQAAYLILITYF